MAESVYKVIESVGSSPSPATIKRQGRLISSQII